MTAKHSWDSQHSFFLLHGYFGTNIYLPEIYSLMGHVYVLALSPGQRQPNLTPETTSPRSGHTTWCHPIPELWKSQKPSPCPILVSGKVKRSPGAQAEDTVILHVDGQEKQSRPSTDQPEWLIGSKEGENIPVMYYWCLAKEEKRCGAKLYHGVFRLELEQYHLY